MELHAQFIDRAVIPSSSRSSRSSPSAAWPAQY